MVVADLVEFIRGPGYVLNFSDSSFSQFFAAELDVDIDDPTYAENGGSKGKRLKCFLQKVDDRTALRTLQALWEVREAYLLQSGDDDPVKNAEARYLAVINRLGGSPNAAQGPQESPKAAFDQQRIAALREDIVELSALAPQARGYAFEIFLKSLFEVFGLKPRDAFRNRGEQIDGSFVLANETYLLEAKWEKSPTSVADLHAFHGKLEQKAAWARGLFISHTGFSEDGLAAWGSGKRVICMDGLDIYEMLQRSLPLDHVLDRKVRHAAETGRAFVRVRELFP
ncbi:MAG: restriction endonuclease [Parvibaculum sp.]|nr:restriction endonuclease [Parvibaculum sp.]MBO6690793.1 restriction endonuclease [Parvibaculum sp.]MBO6713767.1 restriction endonuclease [Parvibaculum sp.]